MPPRTGRWWSCSSGATTRPSSCSGANREMLEAIAAYLLKKETITGQEMMAILEGRDPEQEEYYGVKSVQDNTIEAPAKHIHMTSEPIAMPAPAEEAPKAEEGSADPQ